MRDRGKIIVGLVVFLILITFPVWYNVAKGKATYVPELQRPAEGTACVRDSAWMIANHMDLLNTWRDRVVRADERWDVDQNGKPVEMSLTHTCLGCHQDRAEFCDKCHTYMDVNPYCWDCHVDPKENL